MTSTSALPTALASPVGEAEDVPEPLTEADPESEPRPDVPDLRRLRRAGLVVFLLQLVGFGVWSTVVWDRFSLTWDFSLLYGATSKISHSPFSPALHVVEAHFDAVILWPLAWLIRLPPHGLLLLWAQDAAVAAAGAVAYLWVCDILERRSTERSLSPKWLAGLGLVLLVVNPWIFLTPAFDIHLEAFGTVFIVLAGRALYRGRTRASLLWVVATLSCGFVAATYVAGLAIGALLAGKRRQRLVGMGLLVAGALGVLIMTVAGQGSAFLIVTYGYLTGERPTNLFQLAGGLLLHPGAALKLLWDQHVRILVNLAPAGILGVFSGWGSGIALLLILANTLQNNDGLRVPSFQWQVVYLFVSVGTIVVLVNMSSQVMTRLARRGVVVLAVFIAADTVGWAAVWTPRLPGIWLRVSPSAAQELRKLDHMIPKNAPVIVSQGIVGDFPSHPYCFVLNDEEIQLPRETRPVWVVLAPTQGIETTYPGQLQALVTQLAESGDAKLVTYGAGIWGFLWSPPAGTKLTPVPGSTAAIGGWTIAGPAGRADVSGPPAQWAAESGGRAGYVVSGDYYHRDLGTYRASVTLSSSGPADIEVWDHTGNRLISKFPVAGTTGPTTESFPVTLWRTYPYRDIYGGWGPFRFTPAYIPAGNDLELRVWQPGNSDVKVYSVSLS